MIYAEEFFDFSCESGTTVATLSESMKVPQPPKPHPKPIPPTEPVPPDPPPTNPIPTA